MLKRVLFVRRLFTLAVLALAVSCIAALGQGQRAARGAARSFSADGKSAEGPFVFTYFVKNGEDGLHLAYSEDGLTWEPLNGGKPLVTPTVGKDKLMRDPHVTRGPDGLYHMVWTSSWTDPVIGYASSKDLIHWSEQRAIRPMEQEPTARNVWAPETFYDPEKKQYLIFWSTTIPGRFLETDNPGDKGYNHRIYYTTTKDFRTFAPTRLFFEPGFNVIDATIVREGRRYILFHKDETRGPVAKKNLRWAESPHAEGPYGPSSEPITGKYWAEGPTAIKIGRRWIVYFDKYTEHRYGAVASEDLKRWEDISDRVKFPTGARHGTALRVPRSVLAKLLALK